MELVVRDTLAALLALGLLLVGGQRMGVLTQSFSIKRVLLSMAAASCFLWIVLITLSRGLLGTQEEWHVLLSRGVSGAAYLALFAGVISEGKTSLARWARRLLGSRRDE